MQKRKWNANKIEAWSLEALPELTCQGQYLKLEEEIGEAWAEIGKDREKWLEEMADVSVVATILERRFRSKIGMIVNRYIDNSDFRHEIMEARDKKMDKNALRKWNNTNDGRYHHG